PLPPNVMPDAGTSVVFEELPVSVRLPAEVWLSPTVNAIAPVLDRKASCRAGVLLAVGAVLVGGVETDVTVTTNVSVALSEPSLTRTVMAADAVCLCLEFRRVVRRAPLPPNVMPDAGTSVVFEELPVSVRLPAEVWLSPTVNAIAPV